jgi:hypothetical protein
MREAEKTGREGRASGVEVRRRKRTKVDKEERMDEKGDENGR